MGADRQQVDQASWGLLQPGTLNRVVVVSPHFDDAALGAAHLISAHPGTTVITVLGGRPPAYPAEPTDWDACGGFVAGDDVVALRREEDRAAMAFLGATPVWLEFADHQYLAPEARPRPAEVAPALTEAIAAADPERGVPPHGAGQPRPRPHPRGRAAGTRRARRPRGGPGVVLL